MWDDDIYQHSKLQRELKTAICLDESIRQVRDAEEAIELGACRIINVKVGRVGGFSEAIAIHDLCQRHDIPVWCGGMLETGIGRAHNVALSTLPNFRLPGDVSASTAILGGGSLWSRRSKSRPRGTIPVRDVVGTGYEVRTELIRKLTVREETIRG